MNTKSCDLLRKKSGLFRMWKHFGNFLEMVRILFENLLCNVGEKNTLLVCVHHPHAGECVTTLHVIISFFLYDLSKLILKLSEFFEVMLFT